MKQSERQERSRALILEAAAEEFARLGYEGVTVDGICAGHGISKGMMYHYFSGREELFLKCAGAVFTRLSERVRQVMDDACWDDISGAMREYFLERERYFADRPVEKAIFENAMFRTPHGLEEKVAELHEPLSELNREFARRLTERLTPRPGHTKEELQRYFEAIDRVYWPLLGSFNGESGLASVENMVRSGETLLDMLIFGAARE